MAKNAAYHGKPHLPAVAELRALVPLISSDELQHLLVENPVFGKLPASGQMRYLMAARLDLPVMSFRV